MAGSSNTDTLNSIYRAGTIPSVVKATEGATNRILGYMVDVDSPIDIDDALRRRIRPASQDAVIFVALANDMVFECQADEDVEAGDIGSNANYEAGAGGIEATGTSSAQLDSSSIGADATAQLTILGAVNREDNELGDYCKVEVFTNLPRIAPGVSGV